MVLRQTTVCDLFGEARVGWVALSTHVHRERNRHQVEMQNICGRPSKIVQKLPAFFTRISTARLRRNFVMWRDIVTCAPSQSVHIAECDRVLVKDSADRIRPLPSAPQADNPAQRQRLIPSCHQLVSRLVEPTSKSTIYYSLRF